VSIIGDEGGAAFGQDVGASVAASFGPFVGLIGKYRTGQAEERVAVREIPAPSVLREFHG
jgi:hypothetical protein